MRAEILEEIDQIVSDHVVAKDPVGWELECLWYDLSDAQMQAADMNREWSMQCEDIVDRIVSLTRYAGQTIAWEAVPLSLIINGIYQRINEGLGFTVDINMELARKLWDAETERQKWLN